MNMLIAIMGDTFGKVSESHEQHSREMKIALLSDYVAHIKSLNSNEQFNSFLVLVTAANEGEKKNEWEGSINMIKSNIDKSYHDLR